MTEQLTIGDIYRLVDELKAQGMTLREIKKLPIYIGNDDELNGIHCAWYNNFLDTKNPDCKNLISMINDDSSNIEITDKAILIS